MLLSAHVERVGVSRVRDFFSYKVVELVGGGSVINGAYPSSFLNTLSTTKPAAVAAPNLQGIA